MTRNRFRQRAARLQLEHLEDRSVPSTFTVNTTIDEVTPADGKLSLREAITKANTTPGADVIVVPAGVFKIALTGAGEDANLTGDFDITDAVTIQGAGAGLTIIDAQQKDRVFDVLGTGPSSIKAVFAGLTVRNGQVTGNGGGIRVGNADLVVRDSVVVGNRASIIGGGIANGDLPGTGNVKVVRATVARNASGNHGGGLGLAGSSTLTVTDSTVRRNVASAAGGGIDASTATLTNSTVSGNSAKFGGGGIDAGTTTLTNSTVSSNSAGAAGGGITAGTATLTNSTVSGNSAGGQGGGIAAGTATLTNSTVSGNSAKFDGGGILAATTATLTRSTISGNTTSGSGGGIFATTMATLTNTTISENTAADQGGGLSATTATLLNCTVVENIANTGGGLFHVAGGTFSVRNTIVALNLVAFGGNGPDAFGASYTSQGHNLIGDGTASNGFGVNGDIVGTAASPIDPKLGPLANNGGPSKTMALLAGSPAIDHGDNTILPQTDQRGAGFPRLKDGNGDGLAIVDIGAFER